MDEKINEYKKLFESNNPNELIQSYKSLKEDMFGFTKPIFHGKDETELLNELWGLIKRGLLNENGNVRNYAFYTFKDFRISLTFHNTKISLDILKELHDLASKSQDKKIKMALLRCVLEMKCIALDLAAKNFGKYQEYNTIMDFALKETEGRYEKMLSERDKRMQQFTENMLKSAGKDEKTEKVWNENMKISEELADAYYDSVLDNFESGIAKEDSMENFGYNTFVEGIRTGLDIIIPMLDDKSKEAVKEKIKKMIERRNKLNEENL